MKSLPKEGQDSLDRLTLTLSALHPQGNVWLAERIGCGSPELAGGQRGRRALKKYLPALREELDLDATGFVAGRIDTWVVRDHALLLQINQTELSICPLLRVLSDAEARYVAWQVSIDLAWTSNQDHGVALPDGGGPDDTSYLAVPPEDNILDFDPYFDSDNAVKEISKANALLSSRTSKDHPDMGMVPTVYVPPPRRVPQQYVLASAHWNDTQRYVVLRGAPDQIQALMKHFVECGHAPHELPYVRLRRGSHLRLNELQIRNAPKGPAREFSAALNHLEKDHHGLWGSVRAVFKTLKEWVEHLEDPKPRRGPVKRAMPEQPDQLIRTAITDVYGLEPDPEKSAEMIGVRRDGRKVPVQIAISPSSEITLEQVKNAETHLVAVQDRSRLDQVIFEVIYEGPRSMLSISMIEPSIVLVEDLRRENGSIQKEKRLSAGQ